MIKLLLILCFSVGVLFAQEKPLLVYEQSVNAHLPFYDVNGMNYYQYNSYKRPKLQTYTGGEYLLLGTHDKFYILDAEIAKQSTTSRDLLTKYNIRIRKEQIINNQSQIDIRFSLEEKNWEAEKLKLKQIIEKELKAKFTTYKLNVTLRKSISREGKAFLKIQVYSNTGGDEFETSKDEASRVLAMMRKVKPVVQNLLYTNHTLRLEKLWRDDILPVQEVLKQNYNPSKIDSLCFNIKWLGKYNADKSSFESGDCDNGFSFRSLRVPLEQAKKMRENPTGYQLRSYIFRKDKSQPWSPRDPLAFGFFEIIDRETSLFVSRAYVRFSQSSSQAYYKYRLSFPEIYGL